MGKWQGNASLLRETGVSFVVRDTGLKFCLLDGGQSKSPLLALKIDALFSLRLLDLGAGTEKTALVANS